MINSFNHTSLREQQEKADQFNQDLDLALADAGEMEGFPLHMLSPERVEMLALSLFDEKGVFYMLHGNKGAQDEVLGTMLEALTIQRQYELELVTAKTIVDDYNNE